VFEVWAFSAFGWVPCIGIILSEILILASKLETLP